MADIYNETFVDLQVRVTITEKAVKNIVVKNNNGTRKFDLTISISFCVNKLAFALDFICDELIRTNKSLL